MRTRRCLMVALALCVLCTASACGSETTAKAPTPPSGHIAVSSVRYTSKAFAVRLTVTVPASLGTRPQADTPTFLTWVRSDSDKVRFLLPAAVYRPGHSTPEKPPGSYEKYLAFLRGHADYHVTWRNEVERKVDGHPATLMTATTDWSLDGVLGCPTPTGDAGEECYGLQPDLAQRVAVIDLGDRYLVAWTTVNIEKEHDTSADFARFEAMLRSIRFSPAT